MYKLRKYFYIFIKNKNLKGINLKIKLMPSKIPKTAYVIISIIMLKDNPANNENINLPIHRYNSIF